MIIITQTITLGTEPNSLGTDKVIWVIVEQSVLLGTNVYLIAYVCYVTVSIKGETNTFLFIF